ncbi:hypothetical protein FRC10_010811 [Ceratobasidium sp. 414]|nr:hypothetical protein FRC10_010811 [Ceratobasidium sp. 414]
MDDPRIAELEQAMDSEVAKTAIDASEPATTTSQGVTPGRALLDPLPPGEEPEVLNRNQRSRRPTPSGAEYKRTRTINKQRSKKSTRTKERKRPRQSNQSTPTHSELNDTGPGDTEPDSAGPNSAGEAACKSDAQMEPGGGGQVLFDSQGQPLLPFDRDQLVDTLSGLLSQDCQHLPDSELREMFTTICEQHRTQIEGMMTPDHTQTTMLTSQVALKSLRKNSTIAARADPNPDTATEPLDEDDEDDNENPLVKRSHTTRLLATAASTPGDPANDTATEPEPATTVAPESIQLRHPSRTPRLSQQPSQPLDEDDEVVPETDPEILAGHPPRLANSRIYGSNRSHIRSGSAFESSQPSWRELLHAHSTESRRAIPPNPNPSHRTLPHHHPKSSHRARPYSLPALEGHAPGTQPSKPKPKPKPKSQHAALREGAKRQLEQLVDPPNPVADARTDMVANATQRLKHLVMSTIGRKERQRSGKRSSAARNGKGIREVDAGEDGEEDEDDEEGEDEDGEDEDGEDEDGEGMALAESTMVSSRKLKPRTNMLKGHERQVIVIAKILLFVYTLAYGPYLTRETYLMWAPLVYEIAWYHVFPSRPYHSPSEIAYPIMVNNLATLKCNVKLSLRPVTEFIFKLKKPALTQADIDHNLNIIRYVYPLRFHCTDPWARRGHYEGLVIPRAIAAALFNSESSVGVMFHEFFDPIPIPTLAYILTNIEFCLSEWTTGRHQPLSLKATGRHGLLNMYLSHTENIRRYRTVRKKYLDDLRYEWFQYGLVYSGASLNNSPDLENLFDVEEFKASAPRQSQSSHTSNNRERPRTQIVDCSDEAESSHGRRHRPIEHEYDADIAMAAYEADIEATFGDDAMHDAMDADNWPLSTREGSYEFPDPTPQPPTPSERDEGYPLTNKWKGKGRATDQD